MRHVPFCGCEECVKKAAEAKRKLPLGAPLEANFFDETTVNHPRHYTTHQSGVECIQITEHFCSNLGNVIKYIWRAEEKGAPLQDLKKALWYLDREIKKREKNA